MKSNLISLIFYLIPLSGWCADSHLSILKEKFPYGLLSDDFGILNETDLKINTCGVVGFEPLPAEPHISPYQYWHCFQANTISLSCDHGGTPDEDEGPMGLIVVKASADQVIHDYIERRPWKLQECRGFLKDIAKILKGQKYACISGSFIDDQIDKKGHKTRSWVFDRLKTKKGCEGRSCDAPTHCHGRS